MNERRVGAGSIGVPPYPVPHFILNSFIESWAARTVSCDTALEGPFPHPTRRLTRAHPERRVSRGRRPFWEPRLDTSGRPQAVLHNRASGELDHLGSRHSHSTSR